MVYRTRGRKCHFINGHNGHIGKVNSANYDCLGKLLTQQLGDSYFAIGTDAGVTSFNSQTDSGFKELKVKNQNDLTSLAAKTEQEYYYVDFGAASVDDTWNSIISDKQRMTSLNVTVVTTAKAFYTIQAKRVSNEVINPIASLVSKHYKDKNGKQTIYHAIIAKYGQKRGLNLYNHIKNSF